MEEELSLDNILEADEIENLFIDEPKNESSPNDTGNEEDGKENKDNKTTEVNVDALFTEEPESVGSEKNNKEEKEDTSPKEIGTSPNDHFYSSIAKALKEEGIFPDLEDETLAGVKSPEDFRDLVEQQIRAGLDERQRVINEALNAGVEVSEIQNYERVINFFDNIKEENITQEGDEGEKLRKNLIYQDFINRGYSKERAEREVQKSFNAGTDIDDAKEAVKSNLEFFKDKYNNLIEEAKKETAKEEKDRKAQAEKLKSAVLNDKEIFGDLSIDKPTRQRIYDNLAKPVYKDPETGNYYTAIQKYEMEHKVDFLKNIGLIFTLTDGFKNFDGLVKGKVRKEVKKGLRELENTLNNTARASDGSLRYASGINEDPESFFNNGWKLDI